MVSKKDFYRGFSLVEIIIAIIILGLLVFSSVIFIPKQVILAKDARIKADLYKIYLALENYYDSNNTFPNSLPECGSAWVENSHTYLDYLPCDPYDNFNYLYQSGTDDIGNWFKVYAKLKNTDDAIISTVGCSFGCGPGCEYNYGVSSSNTIIDSCPDPSSGEDPIMYACSPGGGSEGSCDQYDDPEESLCPKVFENDPTCNNECSNNSIRCKNASGKHTPD